MSVQCACFTPYRAGSIREIRRESVPSAGRLILATLTRGADDAMELEIRSGLADDSLSNLPSVTNRRLQTLVARLDGKMGKNRGRTGNSRNAETGAVENCTTACARESAR